MATLLSHDDGGVAKLAQRNRNFLLIFSNLLSLVLASNSIDFHSIPKRWEKTKFRVYTVRKVDISFPAELNPVGHLGDAEKRERERKWILKTEMKK